MATQLAPTPASPGSSTGHDGDVLVHAIAVLLAAQGIAAHPAEARAAARVWQRLAPASPPLQD